MRLVTERGGLVGALVCDESDEILAIADSGIVIRSPLRDIRVTGRDTMGVSLMGLAPDQSVVAIARAAEIVDTSDGTLTVDETDSGEMTHSKPPEGIVGGSSESDTGTGPTEQ